MLIKKGGNRRGNQLSPSGGASNAYPPLSPSRGFPSSPYASPLPQRASPAPPQMAPRPDPGQASRLDALERRLQAMENNSRSMLNQFTQIQQETMVSLRRDAHGVTEQRGGRNRLEMALRGTQQKLSEMEHRIGRSSAALRDSQGSVQSLAVQNNNMQNILAARGQDTEEMALGRLQEARQEIVDLLQYHDASRKQANLLREDLQNMRMKAETLHGDLQAMSHSSRLQEELFEEETRRTFRSSGGSGGGRVTTTAALEGKVARLQNSLMDTESSMVHENKRNEITQQQQNQKIDELRGELAECARVGEQDLRELQRRTGGTGSADPAIQRLQRDVDSVRSRLDSRLRDSRAEAGRGQTEERKAIAQLKELETGLQREVSARTTREAALKDEVERKLTEIKAYSDDGFSSVKKMTEGEHDQTKNRFRELTEALDLLEKSREEDQEDIEKLFEKQRDERRKLDRVMDDRVDDIGDRLRIAMASLMAARADLPPGQAGQPGGLSMEEIERLQNMNGEGAREQLTKALAETEMKLSDLNTRVEQQDEVIENKLRMVEKSDSNELGVMGDELSQKMDSVTFSQERLKRQINTLDDKVKETPAEIGDLKERMDSTERELTDKVEREARDRREQMDDLGRTVRDRAEREERDAANLARLEREVDEAQLSVTKLSEAAQTMNRVIGSKIKEGKRTREQDTTDLKRNIDRLHGQNLDLKNRIKHPKDYRY